MEVLVGYSGFVGSNISESHRFDREFNSGNIKDAFGLRPELLVYAGVPGTKFLANRFPEKDKASIKSAIRNINAINAKKTVLISTVDVYDVMGRTESHIPKSSIFSDYGYNRLLLEEWVKSNVEDYYIVRLPALFGANLKKNFVHDLIYFIPVMLNAEMYRSINTDLNIEEFYSLQGDGLFHFIGKDNKRFIELRKEFMEYPINALSFTDHRNEYQFYDLRMLWNHIKTAIVNDIRIINLVTEPIKADELFSVVYGKVFDNPIQDIPTRYDIRTDFSGIYHGSNGYIAQKKDVLDELVTFINSEASRIVNAANQSR